jgi:diadenylate cyclase
MGVILTKANQAIQTLERYRAVFTQAMTNLSALEFEELVTMHEVAYVLQRAEMVLRIKSEINRYVLELGNEGRLISMQMEELIGSADEETRLLIKDYAKDAGDDKVREIQQGFKKLTSEELLDPAHLIRMLGYPSISTVVEEGLHPRGYRLLNKIPRLPGVIIQNLVDRFAALPHILRASIEELDEVDGIGEVRARAIVEGLKRIQEQVFIDRQI